MSFRWSVDLILMGIAIAVWILLAIIWAVFMGVPEGSRVWVAGAIIFTLLFIALALTESRVKPSPAKTG